MKQITERIEYINFQSPKEIMYFVDREKSANKKAKSTFLKEIGNYYEFNPRNKRFKYLDADSDNSFVAFVSISRSFYFILKVIQEIAENSDIDKQSSEEILKKIYSERKLLDRIFGSFDFGFLESFDLFCSKIRAESVAYIDDGNQQLFLQLFSKLDQNKNDQSKTEFTGGILHTLTRHYSGFNKFRPLSNGNYEFYFPRFTESLIEIFCFGEVIPDQNNKKLVKEKTLTCYHDLTSRLQKFKLITHQHENGLQYLDSLRPLKMQ